MYLSFYHVGLIIKKNYDLSLGVWPSNDVFLTFHSKEKVGCLIRGDLSKKSMYGQGIICVHIQREELWLNKQTICIQRWDPRLIYQQLFQLLSFFVREHFQRILIEVTYQFFENFGKITDSNLVHNRKTYLALWENKQSQF